MRVIHKDGVPLDYRGTPIAVGAQVVFNLSGALAFGEVVKSEVTKTIPRSWGPEYTYDIRVKTDHPERSLHGPSRVKHPRSVVVITGT